VASAQICLNDFIAHIYVWLIEQDILGAVFLKYVSLYPIWKPFTSSYSNHCFA
jgi:hypothetical protein